MMGVFILLESLRMGVGKAGEMLERVDQGLWKVMGTKRKLFSM